MTDVEALALSNLSDKTMRAVLEDYLLEKGRWSPGRLMARMGILPAYAYAYAYADADAYASADAYADAYTNAGRVPALNLSGGKHLKPGLYFFQQQSGNLAVLRIGWIRRVEGDEYEAHNLVTPLRDGDYKTLFADVANKGPPKKWRFSEPVWAPSPANRFHILGPIPLKPAQWAEVCPKPKGWVDDE